MTIDDFPKEIVKDMRVLIENRRTEKERILGTFDSDIEAYKVFEKVSHNNKVILNANVIYANIHGMKVICGYEEIND